MFLASRGDDLQIPVLHAVSAGAGGPSEDPGQLGPPSTFLPRGRCSAGLPLSACSCDGSLQRLGCRKDSTWKPKVSGPHRRGVCWCREQGAEPLFKYSGSFSLAE